MKGQAVMGEKNPENKERANASETAPKDRTQTQRDLGKTAIRGATKK
jgi:hypothetical protein